MTQPVVSPASHPASRLAACSSRFGGSPCFAYSADKLNGWGSATSPVLYKDLVIVNASIENDSLVALDRQTGAEVWRASGVTESWHAPAFVGAPDGKTQQTGPAAGPIAFDEEAFIKELRARMTPVGAEAAAESK